MQFSSDFVSLGFPSHGSHVVFPKVYHHQVDVSLQGRVAEDSVPPRGCLHPERISLEHYGVGVECVADDSLVGRLCRLSDRTSIRLDQLRCMLSLPSSATIIRCEFRLVHHIIPLLRPLSQLLPVRFVRQVVTGGVGMSSTGGPHQPEGDGGG